MPEILEVEMARALLAAKVLGRRIAAVDAPDAWFLKRGVTPRGIADALCNRALVVARRRGKLILVDVDSGAVLGLHLGMSGRVLVDGEAAGDPLRYASNREDTVWHRFGLRFADGGSMVLRDPRRLGAVELDPDEERLGVDAFELTLGQLRSIAASSRAPVKAVLMDQARIVGLGNLLADEVLWRGGDRSHASARAPWTPRRRGACTERCATPCGSSVGAGDRTPATSPLSAVPGSRARAMACRCSAGRSVAERPTRARSTSADAGSRDRHAQLAEQDADAAFDLVADRSHGLDVLAGRDPRAPSPRSACPGRAGTRRRSPS